MWTTRRRFAGLVSGSLAAAGLVWSLPALARADDDDSGPPNVFFSPPGRPYRAPGGAPYPVVDWFTQADRDHDGKLSLDEFVADSAAFFDILDLNGDGVLDSGEISLYEHNIAPEVLGVRVRVLAAGSRPAGASGARLWLAQFNPGGDSGPFNPYGDNAPYNPDGDNEPSGLPGEPGQPGAPGHVGVPDQGGVLPDDVQPNTPTTAPNPDANLTGAAPYSLIRDPEPVTAADPDYLFDGVVKKAAFLAHAHDNFALLDPKGSGYLTLAGLPQSPVQKLLGRRRRG